MYWLNYIKDKWTNETIEKDWCYNGTIEGTDVIMKLWNKTVHKDKWGFEGNASNKLIVHAEDTVSKHVVLKA